MKKVVRNYFLLFLIIQKTASLLKKFSVSLQLKAGNTFRYCTLKC